ncbi:unnamed protein product, partial [Phaeothamnion confervicola]
MSSLIVKKFNPTKATSKNCIILILGKRASGKSVLISDLLYHLNRAKVPRIVVFSGTEASTGYYGQFVPDAFIFSTLDLDVLERIVENQKKLTADKKFGRIPADTDIRLVLLLDDVGFDKKVLKSTTIREVLMNGRHHGIIFMLALQYSMDISPDLRTNIDYVFSMRDNIPRNVAKLYENFFGVFETLQQFRTVFEQCTQNYECICMDNTNPCAPLQESIQWYKAKLGRSFHFGSKESWEFHKSRYLTEDER